jgi:hypothetical protein
MNNPTSRDRRGRISAICVMTGLASVFSPTASAGDFSIGAGLGYGGGGVNSTQVVSGADTAVSRDEGPGTVSIFVDYLLSDIFSVGFEHNRGFRLAPFSSGASFTGFDGRWFFLAPAPSVSQRATEPDGSEGPQIFIKRYSFFVGLATGIASADITRTDDEVPDVQGSGLYVGIKLGAEYPLYPGVILRPEISSYKTIFSPTTLPSSVSYFSFGVGLMFNL